MYRLFRQALGFLTIVPAPQSDYPTEADLGRLPGYFPGVGLFCGLICCLFYFILERLSSPGSLTAILVVTLLIIVSRGFHLDGLADTADALLSHRSVEEKLEIFKDCHLGTFGVVAIVLDLLLKVALFELALASPQALVAVALTPLWGRFTATVVACRSRYARPSGGLGRHLINGSGRREFGLALAFSLALSSLGGLNGVLVTLGAAVVGSLLALAWRKSLGGATGDLLGASVEIGEIAALALWVALI
ncbi:MAG: adenosylcobinamide-GDP ribazoletransferase [Deltaproteobacteria bacterium]|jgi:adenosylcobinamide-GDP ribazoletransferase|nr:adenosylcobinamide-GDP ribazoletransferase [Deltaproteobacteria bacterium]